MHSDSGSSQFNIFEKLLLFIASSGFMYTTMIPAEIIVEYEAHPIRQPETVNVIDTLTKFFTYELESIVSVNHFFGQMQWWWAILPSFMLASATITCRRTTHSFIISSETFLMIALWWLLTEGIFLLKSLANLVRILKMVADTGATFHCSLILFSVVLFYYTSTYMYLAFELFEMGREKYQQQQQWNGCQKLCFNRKCVLK